VDRGRGHPTAADVWLSATRNASMMSRSQLGRRDVVLIRAGSSTCSSQSLAQNRDLLAGRSERPSLLALGVGADGDEADALELLDDGVELVVVV